ncbi:MAG: recombinase family protein [Bacteroidales bacterium]|nr:recombinase family protein [Bacteroidales bacterium]
MIDYKNIRPGKNAVIWTRVSTKYQEDNGGSLESQKRICREYAEHNEFIILEGGDFGGKHESAQTPGKMIKQMVDFVKKTPAVSTVLVSEFDRFSRCSWQAIKMLHEMREMGIIVTAAKFGLDTRTKEGMMMAQNTLSFAELDNQNRTDKFVTGKEDCLRAGAWVLKAPFGYYKTGKSRSTECHLNENGKLLKKAFIWKLQGVAGTEILKRLSAHGLDLSQQRLHQILTNPFYAGKIKHKATNYNPIDGQIEPTVSYLDFLKVQQILSGKTGKYKHAKKKPELPLTGHLFCALDSHAFTSYTKHKRTKHGIVDYHYYKCNSPKCGTNVPCSVMHDKYYEMLKGFNMEPETLVEFSDTLKSLLDQYNEVAINERTNLRRQLSEIDNQLQSMALRRALGEISKDVYEIGNRELLKRKEGLETELGYWHQKLSNSNSIIPTIIATASNISSLWKNGSLEIKQDIQKLVFPEGIFWDKQICDYRTENKNEFFDLMHKYSTTYTKTKETSPCELVSLCGR